MGIIKKLLGKELVGWEQDPSTEVYPVTSTKAIFDENNQNLDTIIKGLRSSGGSNGNTSSYESLFAWSYAEDDNSALTKLNQTEAKYPPTGWYSGTNFKIPDNYYLYMTTAKRINGQFIYATEGTKTVIWSTPIRLGSNNTSNTGNDGNGYSYAYARMTDDTSPTLNKDVITVSNIETARANGQGIDSNGNYSTNETNVWYDHPLGITYEIQTEWVIVFKGNDTDGWTLITDTPVLWSKWGRNGIDGDGIEYIFTCPLNNTEPDNVSFPLDGRIGESGTTQYNVTEYTDSNYLQDDFIPNGWHDEPQELDSTHTKQYVSIRKRIWSDSDLASTWYGFSEPKLWSLTPLIIAGEDLIQVDWSNDNVNITPYDDDTTLKKNTLNELRVTMGSDEIPYQAENADSKGRYYTVVENTDNTTVDEITIQGTTKAQVYVSKCSFKTNVYVVGVTITVCYDGTNTYTIHSAFNVNVKEVAYDVILSPSGFSEPATMVNLDSDMTVQIRKRAAKESVAYLTDTELIALMGTTGSFYYTIDNNGVNKPFYTNGVLADNITYADSKWTLATSTKASELGLTGSSRKIEVSLYSDAGYEDSETSMIARDGDTGDEGPGSEYIFTVLADDVSDFNSDGSWANNNPNAKYTEDTANTNYTEYQNDDFVPTGWFDDIQNVDEQNKVQYVSIRKKKNGIWGEFSQPSVYNRYVPSAFSLTLDNDSVILDDDADAITTMNVTFCRLRLWNGSTEITGDTDNYKIEVQVYSQNGLSLSSVYKATESQIASISGGTYLNSNESTTAVVSSNTIFTTSTTTPNLAFLVYNQLSTGNYGLLYVAKVKDTNDNVLATLYKVQSIIVKDINATGTSYKLNISNDTWHYLGDSPYNLISNLSDTIISVTAINGATASSVLFKVVPESVFSTSSYTSNDFTVTLPDDLARSSGTDLISSYTVGKQSTYQKALYSVSLYLNKTLLDSENIDCERDGATGPAGTTGYLLLLDNDLAIIDLESDTNSINLLTTNTVRVLYNGTDATDLTLNCDYDDFIDDFNVTVLYTSTSRFGSSGYSSVDFYLSLEPLSTIKEASYNFIITGTKIGVSVSRSFKVTFKQLQGNGVSYMLNVQPNSVVFNYTDTTKTISNGKVTVTKIENGKDATELTLGTDYILTNGWESLPLSGYIYTAGNYYLYTPSYLTSTVTSSGLASESVTNIIESDGSIKNVQYNANGYQVRFYYCGTSTNNISDLVLLDSETLDCIKNGKQGNNGTSAYTIVLDNDSAIIDTDCTSAQIQTLTTTTVKLYYGNAQTSIDNIEVVENSIPSNWSVQSTTTGTTYLTSKTYYLLGSNGTEGSYYYTIHVTKGSDVISKRFTFTLKEIPGIGTSYSLAVTPQALTFDSTSTVKTYSGTISANKITSDGEVHSLVWGTDVIALGSSSVTTLKGKLYAVAKYTGQSTYIDITASGTINQSLAYNQQGYDVILYYCNTPASIDRTTATNGTLLLDSEHIDALTDVTTIDTTDTHVQGSGTFVLDPQNVNVKVDLSYTSSVSISQVQLVFKDLYGTGTDYTFNYAVNGTTSFSFSSEFGKLFALSTTASSTSATTTTGLDNTFVYTTNNLQYSPDTAKVNWITCSQVNVLLWTNISSSSVKIYETSIYRTGLDGYYYQQDEDGSITIYSTGGNMTTLSLTAESIKTTAVTSSSNLLIPSIETIDDDSSTHLNGKFNYNYNTDSIDSSLILHIPVVISSSGSITINGTSVSLGTAYEITLTINNSSYTCGTITVTLSDSNYVITAASWTYMTPFISLTKNDSTIIQGCTSYTYSNAVAGGTYYVHVHNGWMQIPSETSTNYNTSGQKSDIRVLCRCVYDGIYISNSCIDGFTVGKTYTVSGYIRAEGNSCGYSKEEVTANGSTIGYPVVLIYHEGDTSTPVKNITWGYSDWNTVQTDGYTKLKDEWKPFYYTFTPTSSSGSLVFYYTWTTLSTTNDTWHLWFMYRINGLTIVEGSLPSAWKPYGISLSSISQTASSIQTQVANNTGRISTIEQNATSIATRVFKDGIQVAGLTSDSSGNTFTGNVKANTFKTKSLQVYNNDTTTYEDSEKVMDITTYGTIKDLLSSTQLSKYENLSDSSAVIALYNGGVLYAIVAMDLISTSSGIMPTTNKYYTYNNKAFTQVTYCQYEGKLYNLNTTIAAAGIGITTTLYQFPTYIYSNADSSQADIEASPFFIPVSIGTLDTNYPFYNFLLVPCSSSTVNTLSMAMLLQVDVDDGVPSPNNRIIALGRSYSGTTQSSYGTTGYYVQVGTTTEIYGVASLASAWNLQLNNHILFWRLTGTFSGSTYQITPISDDSEFGLNIEYGQTFYYLTSNSSSGTVQSQSTDTIFTSETYTSHELVL